MSQSSVASIANDEATRRCESIEAISLTLIEARMLNEIGKKNYSTVTDFARLRGWSTSQPRRTAM